MFNEIEKDFAAFNTEFNQEHIFPEEVTITQENITVTQDDMEFK